MAKNIKIYKGNVYRVFVEDVKLVDGNVVPTVNNELVEENAEFYTSLNSFIKLDTESLYVKEDEASDYVYFYLDRHKNEVIDYLNNSKTNNHDRKEFLEYLKAATGCRYIFPSKMKYDHDISKAEFKELRKQRKEAKKKKNN